MILFLTVRALASDLENGVICSVCIVSSCDTYGDPCVNMTHMRCFMKFEGMWYVPDILE